MKLTGAALAVAALTLTLTAGCGGGEAEPAAIESAQPRDSGSSGPLEQGEDAPVTGAAPTPAATAHSGGPMQVLHAAVGTKEYPDAYVIRLTEESRQPVTTLSAGNYTIEVRDFSSMHNFHLTGPGGVEQSSTVPAVTDTTWQVKLTPGTYTFVCDPHPSMTGEFTVA